MKLEHIFKEHEFTEAERIFMNESDTANTADMNQSRVVSELILGKRIEKSAIKLLKRMKNWRRQIKRFQNECCS